jgi:TetR/AcrR family transcriptional regulator, transcriptional repressor for nem operon
MSLTDRSKWLTFDVMRARAFDESEVIDRAMVAFWRYGYDGCAISHLVEATGVQRQSLYNVFGDKDGLFLATLTRYRHRVTESLAPLDDEAAGLEQLRAYIHGALDVQRAQGTSACLLVKTAFGPSHGDARVRKEVEAGAEAVRATFTRVIRRCVASGELPAKTDPRTAAAYLYAVLNGLSALSATGGTEHAEAALEQAFRSIGASRKKKAKTKRRRK